MKDRGAPTVPMCHVDGGHAAAALDGTTLVAYDRAWESRGVDLHHPSARSQIPSTSVTPRPREYFRSISAELDVQAERVRCLIGDKHWGMDGNHKEALVRGLIERHTPSATTVSRAFLLATLTPNECSREQDVVVLDTLSDAPLFAHGGLVIASVEHALACISVKTDFAKKEFLDSVRSFATVPARPDGERIFFGSYHFSDPFGGPETSAESVAQLVAGWLDGEPKQASLVCRISSRYFLVIDGREPPGKLRVYETQDGATAFFVARLLSHVSASRAARTSFFADALDAVEDVRKTTTIELT